jgi:hypothetical protein
MSEITIKQVAELGCPHCQLEFEITSDERLSEVSTRENWETRLTCPEHGNFLYRYQRHFGYPQEGALGQWAQGGWMFWTVDVDIEGNTSWAEYEVSSDE